MDEDLDEEDEEAVQAGSGPAPAQLLEPGEFDAAHLAELRTDILHKMLSAETVLSGRFKGAKGGWEALVGRLVAHASDEQGAEEMDAVVDYAAADFRARLGRYDAAYCC